MLYCHRNGFIFISGHIHSKVWSRDGPQNGLLDGIIRFDDNDVSKVLGNESGFKNWVPHSNGETDAVIILNYCSIGIGVSNELVFRHWTHSSNNEQVVI